MTHALRRTLRGTAAAALVLTAGLAAAQEDGVQRKFPPDARKMLVEGRTEEALESVQTEVVDLRQTERADVRKEAIEVRTEQTLGRLRLMGGAPEPFADAGKFRVERRSESLLSTPQPLEIPAPADNPKVAPGRVAWHADLAAAQAAARRSGKPVLVFQLLGNLDDEFC